MNYEGNDFGNEEQQDPFDLSKWDEEFENAQVEKRDFDNVPDGKYQVIIDRVQLMESQTSKKPMLKWGLKIIAPNNVGRLLWRNNMIASSDNIKWLKSDLLTCGIPIKKLSELPVLIEKLLDRKIEVSVRTNGANQNVYINRLIDSGGPDSGGGAKPYLDAMNSEADDLFE